MAAEDEVFSVLDYDVVSSISAAAEVRLAWKKERDPSMSVGHSLTLSPSATDPGHGKISPFAKGAHQSPHALVYVEDCTGDYKEDSTSGSSSSREHLSIGIGVTVGPPGLGKLLNVGVRGSYDRTVTANTDSDRSSIHSTFRMGMITFDTLPRLSADAFDAIPSRYSPRSQQSRFIDQYGDYYVAALILGGDNSIMMSASMSDKTTNTTFRIQVTMKVLFWTATLADVEKKTVDVEASSELSLVGFDTLDNVLLDYRPGKSKWKADRNNVRELFEHKAKAKTLESRIRARMEGFGLRDGAHVSEQTCNEIIKSGLVAEILLCPITKHPEYIEARSRLPQAQYTGY